MTASLATAIKTSVDAAVAAFISELDGIFTVKEEQKQQRRLSSMENMFSLYSFLASARF